MSSARQLVLALLLLAACSGGGSPTSPGAKGTDAIVGHLTGVVTIGPNCPVEQAGVSCPTSPDAYAQRKILVYDAAKTKLLNTVDINSQGLYAIDLVPGKYTVDAKLVGIDRASGVPTVVDNQANTTTRVEVSIDTGIR